jgi:hypothetical protein
MVHRGATDYSPVNGWLRSAVIATFGPRSLISVHECSSAVPLPSSPPRRASTLCQVGRMCLVGSAERGGDTNATEAGYHFVLPCGRAPKTTAPPLALFGPFRPFVGTQWGLRGDSVVWFRAIGWSEGIECEADHQQNEVDDQ